MTHAQQWRELADELIRHYGVQLSTAEREDLYDAYRGMPRGRVGHADTGHFVLAFNELPERLSWPDQRQRLITDFALHEFADHISDHYGDEHETLAPDHTAIVERLLRVKIPVCPPFLPLADAPTPFPPPYAPPVHPIYQRPRYIFLPIRHSAECGGFGDRMRSRRIRRGNIPGRSDDA